MHTAQDAATITSGYIERSPTTVVSLVGGSAASGQSSAVLARGKLTSLGIPATRGMAIALALAGAHDVGAQLD